MTDLTNVKVGDTLVAQDGTRGVVKEVRCSSPGSAPISVCISFETKMPGTVLTNCVHAEWYYYQSTGLICGGWASSPGNIKAHEPKEARDMSKHPICGYVKFDNDLEEMLEGLKKSVCSMCGGGGSIGNSSMMTTCSRCHGTGRVEAAVTGTVKYSCIGDWAVYPPGLMPHDTHEIVPPMTCTKTFNLSPEAFNLVRGCIPELIDSMYDGLTPPTTIESLNHQMETLNLIKELLEVFGESP